MDLTKIIFDNYHLNENMIDTSERHVFFDKHDNDENYIEIFYPDKIILEPNVELPLIIINKVEDCSIIKTVILNLEKFKGVETEYKFIGKYIEKILEN